MVIVLPLLLIPSGHSVTTVVAINPPLIESVKGQFFNVNVTVADVTNLNSWQIVLSFNKDVLNCTGVWIPTNNIFAGYAIFFPTPTIDNTAGQVKVFCALEGTTGVSGSGNLCTIRFKSKEFGVSKLAFKNVMKKQIDGTYLLDPSYALITFEARGGIAKVITSGFQEKLFNVTQNAQTFLVEILSNSTITEVSFNQTFKELSFKATGLDGTKGACIVTIPSVLLNSTLIVLINDVGIRTFSNTPILNTLPENTTHCITFFNYTHSTKTVKIRKTTVGDLNGDRKVDIQDVARASSAFGSYPNHPKWNPAADVDQNWKVDIKDLAIVSSFYGTFLPNSGFILWEAEP